jgi:L,D-peptidoglycan transpeptidase YkuD (ErfK/YbiS/YcfS/YnhG family)
VDDNRSVRRASRALLSATAAIVLGTGLLGGPVASAAAPPLPARLRHLGNATQSIVVTSSSWRSTTATLEAYEKRGGTWRRVLGPVKARVGWAGMIAGNRRKQGSGTTPAGTYAISSAFGTEPDPGARLRYRYIDSADWWWVEDPTSRYYNTMRFGSQGGFRLTERGRYGSEQLINHQPAYHYAAVIDFNRPRPVKGRGAGIFLHVNGAGATAGCVSVPQSTMVDLLRWLDPAKHPRITMAPRSVVTRY